MMPGFADPLAAPKQTIEALLAAARRDNGAVEEAFITFVTYDLNDGPLFRRLTAKFFSVYPELSKQVRP